MSFDGDNVVRPARFNPAPKVVADNPAVPRKEYGLRPKAFRADNLCDLSGGLRETWFMATGKPVAPSLKQEVITEALFLSKQLFALRERAAQFDMTKLAAILFDAYDMVELEAIATTAKEGLYDEVF